MGLDSTGLIFESVLWIYNFQDTKLIVSNKTQSLKQNKNINKLYMYNIYITSHCIWYIYTHMYILQIINRYQKMELRTLVYGFKH